MSARRLNLGARIRARSQSVRVLVENALRIDVDGMIRRGCLRPGVHIEGESMIMDKLVAADRFADRVADQRLITARWAKRQ
jgi:hypothetical protein